MLQELQIQYQKGAHQWRHVVFKNPVGLGDSSAGKVLACKCKHGDLRAETRVKSGVWRFVNASSQGVETGGSLGSLAPSLTWR